jgi:hypothetical protein
MIDQYDQNREVETRHEGREHTAPYDYYGLPQPSASYILEKWASTQRVSETHPLTTTISVVVAMVIIIERLVVGGDGQGIFSAIAFGYVILYAAEKLSFGFNNLHAITRFIDLARLYLMRLAALLITAFITYQAIDQFFDLRVGYLILSFGCAVFGYIIYHTYHADYSSFAKFAVYTGAFVFLYELRLLAKSYWYFIP